jgi:hypothetical protein
MTRLEDLDELQQYVFSKAPRARAETAKATATAAPQTAASASSLLPDERICEVFNEQDGDAVLIDDVVVIHRDCGFLRQCTLSGWKTLYSAEQIAGSGKVQAIQVRVCTYNHWHVMSFACGCALCVAIIVRICGNTFTSMMAPKGGGEAAEAEEGGG